MTQSSQNKIWFIHALRGIAAFSVLIWHYCGMFWYNNNTVVQSFNYMTPKQNSEYLMFFNIVDSLHKVGVDLGALGVAIFFLISGFVISLTLEKYKGISFLIARLFRIYPAYIIGFSITFGVIFLYSDFHGVEFPYGFSQYLPQILLIRDWLWIPSIDGVSWTLETEIKFYLIACLMAYFGKLKSARNIVAVTFSFCLFNILIHNKFAILLTSNIRLYQIFYIISYSIISLIFMFIGVCFYNYYSKNWSLKKFIVILQCVYLFFVMSFLSGPDINLIKVYSTTYSFALVFFINAFIVKDYIYYNKYLNFLADISYPMYVVHGVNGYILMSILDGFGFEPYICIFVTTAIIFIISYLLHRYVESPTNLLGKKLIKGMRTTVIQWQLKD